MPRKIAKKDAPKQGSMLIQILEIDKEQLTKIGMLVWAMTGAAIGSLFVLASILVLLLPFFMPQYRVSGGLDLVLYSILITFVLTIFYGMMGGLLGGIISHTINWILEKIGGIRIRVRKLN